MLCLFSLSLKLVSNYGEAGLAGLKSCLLSEVFVETHGNASEPQWLMSETKLNVDQAQMCAQACVRLARAHDSTRAIAEPEQCLLGQRDPKYFESFEHAEGVSCVTYP